MTRIFDVDIQREAIEGLDWPDEERLESDSGLGGNRQYADMRGLDWEDYAAAAACEADLVAQLDGLPDDEARIALMEELENEEDIDADIFTLMGLDPGVASVVIALSAAGCAPFTSCNGGAFGGRHHEYYPLVVFFSRPALAPLLLACAEEADVGLIEREGVVVYARTIGAMMKFGAALHRRRDEIGRLKVLAPSGEAEDADDGQLDLFDA